LTSATTDRDTTDLDGSATAVPASYPPDAALTGRPMPVLEAIARG
jgi:hypothetical protein